MLKTIVKDIDLFSLTKKQKKFLEIDNVPIQIEKTRKRRKSSDFNLFSSFHSILKDIRNSEKLSTIKFLKFISKIVFELENENFTIKKNDFEFCKKKQEDLRNNKLVLKNSLWKKKNFYLFLEIFFEIKVIDPLNIFDLKNIINEEKHENLIKESEFLMFILQNFSDFLIKNNLFFFTKNILENFLNELEFRDLNNNKINNLKNEFSEFGNLYKQNELDSINKIYEEKIQNLNSKVIKVQNIRFDLK